jgi:hypothetical protein
MPRINPAANLAATFRPSALAADDQPFSEQPETVKAVTLRMPLGTFVYLQALAVRGERSKNEMGCELLRLGISALLANLDDDVRGDVQRVATAVARDDFGFDLAEVL